MNIEQLVFTMYKDEDFKGRKALRDKIRKQFKDITDKQLNEITLRIYNYQIDKYGNALVGLPREKLDYRRLAARDKQRRYERRKVK